MKKPLKPIGEILVDLGLITPEQVERGLARQREGGGRLGDALVALGMVTRSEVEWGLADQYDLPFVQLRPESIDRGVAALVPPAWAREHRILPVLRNGDTVTVIVADPHALELSDEVRRFTGATGVEASLASEENILELLDALERNALPAAPLDRWLSEAMRGGARELVVSVRGDQAVGWDDAHPAAKSALDAGWPEGMARRLTPSHPSVGGEAGGVRRWAALLDVGGERWAAECRMAGGGRAWEWLVRVVEAIPGGSRGVPAAEALRRRVAERSGSGTVVRMDAADLSDAAVAALLPELPLALLGPMCRAAHLAEGGPPTPPGVLRLPARPGAVEALAAMEAFHLDAVTLGEHDPHPQIVAAARRAAPLVAFAGEGGAADLRVRLQVNAEPPRWILEEENRGTD